MRTLLLSAFFMVMVALTASATPPSVVLVQNHKYDRNITITRGEGKTETIPTQAPNSKNYQVNAERLHTVLTGLYAEGYVLQSTYVTEAVNFTLETVNYIFVKP